MSAAALAFAGCGGGERQDENEPEGTFEVEVVEATFPDEQKLAKESELAITVRNAGSETIPNIALTVDGFDYRKEDPDLADRSRPVFAINGSPEEIGGLPESRADAPEGGDTAYVNTWALGPLEPNESKSFKWSVTAVRAGRYRIDYRVSAGLAGKAKAVLAGGGEPTDSFTGTISDTPPDARIAEDGRTIVTDDETSPPRRRR